MLTDEEAIIAARAAWDFPRTGEFPSEAVCRHRGQAWRSDPGVESDASRQAWHEIAAAVGVPATDYLNLLKHDARDVARRLLHPRGLSPKSLGWDEAAQG